MAPLFHKLQHQKIEIQERICALRNSQNELAAITANMNEGLIVLSQGGDILSINASAARLFQVSGEQLQGQKLIALNRSDQLAQVAEQALAGKRPAPSWSCGAAATPCMQARCPAIGGRCCWCWM